MEFTDHSHLAIRPFCANGQHLLQGKQICNPIAYLDEASATRPTATEVPQQIRHPVPQPPWLAHPVTCQPPQFTSMGVVYGVCVTFHLVSALLGDGHLAILLDANQDEGERSGRR